MTDRREFLKTSCAALTMTAMATQMRHFGLINALAQSKQSEGELGGNYKALVCVFLDGGNDSNNTVVPNYTAGYAQYAAARGFAGFGDSASQSAADFAARDERRRLRSASEYDGYARALESGKLAVVTNVGTLMQPLTRAQYQSGATRPMQLFRTPTKKINLKPRFPVIARQLVGADDSPTELPLKTSARRFR